MRRADTAIQPWWKLIVVSSACIGAALLSASARAQQNPERPIIVSTIQRDDGTVVELPPSPRRGFSLFGDDDLAGYSLKLKGVYRYPAMNGGGLCPFANTSGDMFNTSCGQGPGGSTFFHNTVSWGVGPEAYEQIRRVWPAIENMRAPIGYSTPWHITSIQPLVRRITAADGQLGSYFSGVRSLNGAGCRDMNGALGAGVPQNFQLTAATDCPETWARETFGGMRAVPDSVWRNRFRQEGYGFRWDDWRIHPSELADAPFMGDLTTYGAFSDYSRQVLQMYGALIPGGQGPVTERGFPLGIEVRYDAFKFDRPALRNGAFIRWLVINNSAKVWGAGIDYEALYLGVDPGYIPVGSAPSAYNMPALGAHVMSGGNVSGKCTTTFPKRLMSAGGGCNGSATQPQHVIMLLKSPLGDLRNKLFSNPSSPYFAPGHPEADDTITFNHWRRGGFGAQATFSWRRSDRSLYGLMSGNEQHWLDGRSYLEFTAAQIWTYFRYEFSTGTQSAENLRYTRSVPGDIGGYGTWDYNDDGIQDTLILPDCGSRGCSGLWGDSVAGGWPNTQAGNIGNWLGMGPFSLRAGDTTELIWYMGSVSGDTAITGAMIRNVTEAYLTNFAAARPYTTPHVVADDIELIAVSQRDPLSSAQVRIRLRMPERTDDPYLARVVAKLQGSDARAMEIRRLNPGIVGAVQGRMRQNLARVLIYKSCDRGKTWIIGSDCSSAVSSRTQDRNGTITGLGWRRYGDLPADSISGVLSSSVFADNVLAGREYLYSFVTQTRALADIQVIYQQTTDAAGNVTSRKIGTLGDALDVDVDTITSPLAASGPSTVTIYAPVSIPAGTTVSRVDTMTWQGASTARVSAVARSPYVEGAFRMRFGNRFILTRTVDTVSGARNTIVIRQSFYARSAPAPALTPQPNFVASADTFFRAGDITIPFNANLLRATPRRVTGTQQVFVDTLPFIGYVIAGGPMRSEPLYFAFLNSATFSSTSLSFVGAQYESAAWFPGFTATVVNDLLNPMARVALLRPPYGVRDTVPTTIVTGNVSSDITVNTQGVVYLPSTSTNSTTNPAGPTGLKSSPGGTYTLAWQGDAFGPGERGTGFFTLGPASTLQPMLDASLQSRPIAAVADTQTFYRNIILAGLNNINSTGTPPAGLPGGAGSDIAFPLGTRPLVAAKLPFKVFGINGQEATVVMNQRHVPGNVRDSLFRNSRLFGTAGDTTRLAIPVDMWMPGDTIYVIERIVADSTIILNGQVTPVVRDTMINNRSQTLPIQVPRLVYGAMLPLGCVSNVTPTRRTCNPVRPGTKGSSNYLSYTDGMQYRLVFTRPFDQNSEVALTATPTAVAATPLTKKDMDRVRVVPNPFVVQSSYDRLLPNGSTTSRILFVNVPPEGMLRIYSVSGQLMQQLSWTQSDLVASGGDSPHGDLPYNLKTREGLHLASGLYLYVLTARGSNANGMIARGKFVVIR